MHLAAIKGLSVALASASPDPVTTERKFFSLGGARRKSTVVPVNPIASAYYFKSIVFKVSFILQLTVIMRHV